MDILTFVWLVVDIVVLVTVFCTKFKNLLPGFVHDLMVYGKNRQDGIKGSVHWSRQLFLVPNRWFTHYYAFGFMWNVFLLTKFYQAIVGEQKSYLDFLRIPPSSSTEIDCFSVMLTLILLTIQQLRRFCECLFVASFSGEMHVAHYALGLMYYFMANLTVAVEIPNSISTGWYNTCLQPLQQISLVQCLAVIMFLWASYHQYQCHAILGKLTSWTQDGKKIYKIPYGDWFNYVSSPHYLAEIIIYISLFLTMKAQCLRFLLLLIFVVSNLTLGAYNTQSWYKKKFEDFPKNRHIIFPYIY